MIIFIVSFNTLDAQYSNPGCGINHNAPSDGIDLRNNCNASSINNFMSAHLDDIVPSGLEKIKIFSNVVLLQDPNGFGNFDIDNPIHLDMLNEIFDEMNNQLSNFDQQSCNCSTNPNHYNNIKIEFVPNFIELKHPTLWDHTNDPTPQNHYSGSIASTDYLHLIRNELLATPGFIEGFDVYITSHGPNVNLYLNNNPHDLPIWNLPGRDDDDIYDGHWYSDYPSTTNLDQPAFWHLPDLFLSQLQTYDGHTGENNIERLHKVADGFLHEYGHLLGLGHRYSCSNNIMNGNWGSRTSLSGCQVRDIYKTLLFKSTRKYVICEMGVDHEIKVNTNETWAMDIRTYSDIIIESGATLTITCKLSMAPETRIIVKDGGKLIVDEGIITSECEKWKGIKVYGGNTDFDVKFTNGATIENTSEAAVSMFAPEPWPAIQNYGNGILHADNTTFNNTTRIAEFMSWSALTNSSYVEDCVQNGGKWSITNWNCQGILIKDNVFNDISNECVVTDHGQFYIEGNEFNSGRSDILYNNTSAGIASIVKENTFNGLNIGYNARGTTYAQNLIHNNNFYTGEIDVMNDGHNQYELYKNSINATFGSASFDNGGGIADVHNNDFSGNLAGTLPTGVNDDYNFYLNCYSTTFTDNYIDGNVSPIIHNNGEAANNCFTHSGNSTSSTNDIGGSPDPFTYLEPVDNPIDCQNAILAHINVNRISSGPKSTVDCGSGIPGGGSTNWNYCFPDRYVYGDVFYAYNWQLEKIKEIENNPYLTQAQKDQLLAIYYRCFKRVRGYLFEMYLKNGEFNKGRLLFAADDSDDAKVFIFSSYIAEDDLVGASNYLDTLENDGSLSIQLEDFIALQRININRIPYGPFYNATAAEVELVKSIAYKLHSYAGYGKALHYVLTGETISSQMPAVLRNEITPRSQDESRSHNTYSKVYPNPFNTTLNVEVSGYEEIDIIVYDFLGKMVYKNSTDQVNHSIATDDWNDGMYIIKVKSEGKIVFTDKVVLIH